MTTLVTGSTGLLGHTLCEKLKVLERPVLGIDILPSNHTDIVGSITDKDTVEALFSSAEPAITSVIHTATLHKPHIVSHSKEQFVDVNVTGTLNLLEECARRGVKSFVFTSSTSVFGHAMKPTGDKAVWVTEELRPITKNIYGVTKLSAEGICELFHYEHKMGIIILRTSRFFPDLDDDAARLSEHGGSDTGVKVLKYLSRRVHVDDVASAHMLALDKCALIGFGVFIISAPTPLKREHCGRLWGGEDLHGVLDEVSAVPGAVQALKEHGWDVPIRLDRVYDSTKAQEVLGWTARHTFDTVLREVATSGGAERMTTVFSEQLEELCRRGHPHILASMKARAKFAK